MAACRAALAILMASLLAPIPGAAQASATPAPAPSAAAGTTSSTPAAAAAAPVVPATAPAAAALPTAFRSVSLGMPLDQVKAALQADPLFRYRGDPDVSFLPQTRQYLIECAGASYLKRAYFQFSDSRLYIMIFMLDPQKLDHYSLFSAFSAKYGQPASLSPQETVWQSDGVRFSLERPLTVKYIDRAAFGSTLEAGKAPRDLEQLSREKFIEQF